MAKVVPQPLNEALLMYELDASCTNTRMEQGSVRGPFTPTYTTDIAWNIQN